MSMEEKNRRPRHVKKGKDLRRHVMELAFQMHDIYKRGTTPKVKTGKKCRSCSLNELCIPKLNKQMDVEKYIGSMMMEAAEGETGEGQ